MIFTNKQSNVQLTFHECENTSHVIFRFLKKNKKHRHTHTHTHTHTCAHIHHTQHHEHTIDGFGGNQERKKKKERKKRKPTYQDAEEKRWVFNFDLKEESEEACLTERGREEIIIIKYQVFCLPTS